jgi:hypothetical protein
LEILREQGQQGGGGTSEKKLPNAPVTAAPKEGHAAWVIERGRLSPPGDEAEAETLPVVKERLLKILDPRTERELPNAEAILSLYPNLGRVAGARRVKGVWCAQSHFQAPE